MSNQGQCQASEALPKGFTCVCGEYHKFPVYVFAHWQERLIYTCKKCGACYGVLGGRARIKRGKEKGPPRGGPGGC